MQFIVLPGFTVTNTCFIVFFVFIFCVFGFYTITLNLGGSNSFLDEVMLHVSLEVEVSELFIILNVKKTGKLGIWVD
jgi:hypothetical protein